MVFHTEAAESHVVGAYVARCSGPVAVSDFPCAARDFLVGGGFLGVEYFVLLAAAAFGLGVEVGGPDLDLA